MNDSLLLSSIITTCMMIALFKREEFYLIFPLFIFFSNLLILPGGIVVFRLYTVLFLLKIYLDNTRINFKNEIWIQFVILVSYSLLVVAINDYNAALSIILDTTVVVLYISIILTGKEKIVKFFRFYVIAAMASALYGLSNQGAQLNTAIYYDGAWTPISRTLATFNDPNYLGFFFNVAIFAVLILDLFRRWYVKWGIILLFYFMLLASLSMTALLCNLSGVAVCILFKKGLDVKNLLILIIIAIVIYLFYSTSGNGISIINHAEMRIESLMAEFGGNMSSLTSGRMAIWEKHLDYYVNQPAHRILFGGNYITDFGYDTGAFNNVSHQTFIDLLLAFGLIITLVYVSVYFRHSFRYLIRYIEKRENEEFFLLMIKFIWLFYAFGLSMFSTWMFNLFFFL